MKPLDRPPYLLTEYSADQWWFKELESLWGRGSHPVTADTRRAAKVACDFVRAAIKARPPHDDATLDFEALLGKFHADVWEAAEGGGVDYDMAGKDTAKAIIAMHRGATAAAQAKIDALMLEHCPEEMGKEQLAEWGRHQRPVERPASELEEKLEGDREAVGSAVRAIGDRPALTLVIVRRLQEQRDEARSLLLWALLHHQGGSSPVGQPIRRALGIGQHDHLTPEQIKQAHAAAERSGK